MDIAALSTSMATNELASQASVKVLAMGLDEMRVEGEGMQKMLEMSVNPHIGGNIDISL